MDSVEIESIDTIIVPEPETVSPDYPLSRALQEMITGRHCSYSVLDAQTRLVVSSPAATS